MDRTKNISCDFIQKKKSNIHISCDFIQKKKKVIFSTNVNYLKIYIYKTKFYF